MSVLNKLSGDMARYWDKPFLKAAMAVCALTALADGNVSLSERYRVDVILGTMERLRVHDPHKAVEVMNDYVADMRDQPERAMAVLKGKIARYAGDYKAARTLLRIAYLVIAADDAVSDTERTVFDQICGSLDVDPTEIWQKLAA